MVYLKLCMLSLVFALSVGVATAQADSASKGGSKPAATKKAKQAKLPAVAKGSTRVKLNVEMCCAHGCPVHVHETLGEMKGVTFVHADFDTQSVVVDYRDKDVKLRAIKDAILALGYPVDGEQPAEPHAEG